MSMPKEKRKIVFICDKKAHRSLKAQGFAEILGKGRLEVSRDTHDFKPLSSTHDAIVD